MIADRAGIKTVLESSHPLLQTLTIPSTILEQHKIELLINHVVFEEGKPIIANEVAISSLLVPSLDAQQSFSGRTTSVTLPVHKTVVLGEGLGGVLSIAGLLQSQEGKTAAKMVQITSEVDWEILPSKQKGIILINTDRGQHAIKTFRQSLQNSITYEKEWLSSGLPAIAPTIIPPMQNHQVLKPMIQDLINHILDETQLAIAKSAAEIDIRQADLNVPEHTRTQMQAAITAWAEIAHTELRDELEDVFASKSWRKLAWWKLLWRVDDVEMIAAEAIRRTYLIEAEKNIIYIAGRLGQAGLSENTSLPRDPEKGGMPQLGNGLPDLTLADIQARPQIMSADSLDEPSSALQGIQTLYRRHPWPSQIALSRMAILRTSIPPLTALAQRYLLSAVSLSSLATFTSALAYLNDTTTGVYEVGTITALGVVYSAYSLQKKWEKAKQDWIHNIDIEGKRVLDTVEQRCRVVIEEGGRSKPDEVEVAERRKALDAVDKVRAALFKINESKAPREA